MRFGRLVAVTALLATILAGTPGAAHALPAGTRVWYHPGGDQYTPSTIWRFDAATATGWKRSFIPSLTAWPVQNQYTFIYRVSGPAVNLRWTLSGGTGRVTSLSYSSAADILVVNYDGYLQRWYGCRSAGRPAFAQAAC